jgi:hypothetical protein
MNPVCICCAAPFWMLIGNDQSRRFYPSFDEVDLGKNERLIWAK